MAGELPIALETVVEAIDDQADARTATKSREETGPAGIGGPADGHATPLIIGCTLNCVKQASRMEDLSARQANRDLLSTVALCWKQIIRIDPERPRSLPQPSGQIAPTRTRPPSLYGPGPGTGTLAAFAVSYGARNARAHSSVVEHSPYKRGVTEFEPSCAHQIVPGESRFGDRQGFPIPCW